MGVEKRDLVSIAADLLPYPKGPYLGGIDELGYKLERWKQCLRQTWV